jgi:predicted nucleic acid-binding protein
LIAVDSNILIYAHRQDSDWHIPAKNCLDYLVGQTGFWAITWPSVHEFISISTHRRIYDPPSTLPQAIHDARIAAICLQHGVSELWTADRDFSRFPKVKVRNPLVG